MRFGRFLSEAGFPASFFVGMAKYGLKKGFKKRRKTLRLFAEFKKIEKMQVFSETLLGINYIVSA